MILINGVSKYAKAERLVSELTEEVMSWIETLEASGFVFMFTNLPSHIKTHEDYAVLLLDKLSEMYLPETENLN